MARVLWRIARPLSASAVCATFAATIAASPALAAPPPRPASYGADISYPQCGSGFPTGMAFGIAGVTGGRVFSQNRCLGGGAGELAWAAGTGKGSLYMNTGDPSTTSPEWANPSGNVEKFPGYTVTPPPGGYENCDPVTDTGFGCDWDYGWNSAQYAYQQATAAQTSSGVDRAVFAGMRWWLDVETANSWTTGDPAVTWSATEADAADVRGAIAGLQYAQQQYASAQGVSVTMPTTGIYTSASSWRTITAGAPFSNPDWVAGARNERAASKNCASAPPTGSEIMLAQWGSSVDYDYPCPVADQGY